MSVTPINIARVSQNLRAFNLLRSIQGNQLGAFRVSNQLATGMRFQTPSEDPLRSAATIEFDARLDRLGQVANNLRVVTASMNVTDASMSEAISLANDARAHALDALSQPNADGETESLSIVVDALIDQMIGIGNRSYLDRYLFSGHFGDQQPFELTGDGVVYHGDDRQLFAITDSDLSRDAFSTPGTEFFRATSTAVRGINDLDPSVTPETRLSDLRGTAGTGLDMGIIRVTDGASTVDIDLRNAATVGDLVDRLNAELPATIEAVISGSGLNLVSTVAGPLQIEVTDTNGNTTARDLGINTNGAVPAVIGKDLDPALTPRTTLASLNAGGGIDLASTIKIRNGSRSADISFNGAQTLEDVLNRINQANVGVWARVGADGSTIEVVNRISGSALSIEENGGRTATNLGIRSLSTATKLADLNDKHGVETVEGADFRVTTASGQQFDFDLDDLPLTDSTTMQDLINWLNTTAAGAFTASLTSAGNGLRIVDNTAGPGALELAKLNESPALDGLGLTPQTRPGPGGSISGDDVNPIKTDSMFTALVELRNALSVDDRQGIDLASERLEQALQQMQDSHGRLAAQARIMEQRAERLDSEVTATQVLRSDVADADLTESIVRFQQLQTALQANLATASKVYDLSLIDYL